MSDRNVARRRLLGGLAAAPLAPLPGRGGPADGKMRLAIGADHAGFPMKGPVLQLLQSWGHTVKDCGTYTPEAVDFPDIARRVCDEVLAGRAQRAILVCGTGVGASIAANKIRNIRAALCHDTYCAHQGVEHDDVNVLCMGAWIVGIRVAEEILAAFLNAKFLSADADFRRRVRKLEEMEKR
jgi:ribose 5-phosphate isomerase B